MIMRRLYFMMRRRVKRAGRLSRASAHWDKMECWVSWGEKAEEGRRRTSSWHGTCQGRDDQMGLGGGTRLWGRGREF